MNTTKRSKGIFERGFLTLAELALIVGLALVGPAVALVLQTVEQPGTVLAPGGNPLPPPDFNF